MGRYARDTNVSVENSQAEIRKILARYGADSFMLGEQGGRAMVQFSFEGRVIRFVLELPPREKFRLTPGRGLYRDDDATFRAWEQGCRQKWRALALFCKSTLEAVDEGIIDFDTAFLPHLVLLNDRTVAQEMTPRIQKAISAQEMPALRLPHDASAGGA